MALQHDLLDKEERFWKGTPEFYREHLTDDALMVFAEPVGVLDRGATVESLAGSPRWNEVGFDEVRAVHMAAGVALLTYRVTARRGAEGVPYRARASSIYVDRGGWKLAFHQQTPAG
jgi:hypothetical protein